MTDFTNSKYLLDMDGKTKTHILVDLGNNRFKSVPIDTANTDYQAIQEWAKIDGNTIAEAD